ncbi:hypothetical protein [Metabacillus endolithicus]|uniref:Uncharacterized protein n=1 Tax=Metabacillus endolithicus TaxID=1535204 RepID=A0ABW5C5T2_9BACI|nr:hypothetical protein [Metabacillus endolithicus]UPG66115.1 hypothetical protein MVE64_27130 [Metabacillus endolithicus]
MEKLLVLLMLLPLWLVVLFQPSLDRLEESREKVIQVALQRGIDKASLEGYFTEDIIDEMKDIVKKVGYEEDDIELELTTTPVLRGNYIHGKIKVPNEYQHLLIKNLLERDTSNEEEMYHVHIASRMSEFVN